MKLLLPFLSLFAVPLIAQMLPVEPGVSQELAVWRAAHYSDVRYKLNLTLEKMSPVLKGTIEIRVKVSEPPASAGGTNSDTKPTSIILDWRKLRGSENLSAISNVSVNGHVVLPSALTPPANAGGSDPSGVTYEESNQHLIFHDGVVAGENVIKLDFTSPILTSGSAITRYIDKEDGSEYIYSLFVPSDASTAFPVFDQPDLKARFGLELTTPLDWESVTNTRLLNQRNTSTSKILGYEETKPISTYLFAFATGRFEVVTKAFPVELYGIGGGGGGKEYDEAMQRLREEPRGAIYVRRSQYEKFKPHVREVFWLSREGLKFLEEYFDYKFPWPKYDLVLIPEFPFGGMEHAGCTFLRESGVIFPSEPTKSDYISRATLIFHETAHQWFGDTVTMKWFDDLWLKEGFANFMAYKALDKIMPEMNAWKVFYERIKQPAYATDSTRGTTAIYQPIKNLSAAKSAYGNIVYNKAPAFLRQAEFYLGEDKFQTAVRTFLKKHEYANATWEDLVKEFESASGQNLKEWAKQWVTQPGMYAFHGERHTDWHDYYDKSKKAPPLIAITPIDVLGSQNNWTVATKMFLKYPDGSSDIQPEELYASKTLGGRTVSFRKSETPFFIFPNYQDYGYGIFLLDDKSRDYVLKNVQNEKDPFLRSMMYGALWDNVREGELDPKEYVELVIKNLGKSYAFTRENKKITPEGVTLTGETDETIIQSLLARATTAMNYYLSEPPTGGDATVKERASSGDKSARSLLPPPRPTATPPQARGELASLPVHLENVLIERMQNAPTMGQKITFYRAFLNVAESENARGVLKAMLQQTSSRLRGGLPPATNASSTQLGSSPTLNRGKDIVIPLKTKDKFDIVTRLAILGDPDTGKLLADLEKTETSGDAKRYAYAAHAAFATKANREKFWNDFINNKQISESWIEAAVGPFNSIRHSDLSLPYLGKALSELPNLKRDRKIFFVNGWLGAFIGGQKSQQALDIVNKFLAGNPNLDNDLRLKILENVDIIERAVKIRKKFSHE